MASITSHSSQQQQQEQSSSDDEVTILSVGKVKSEMSPKILWAKEFRILERVFKTLMFDMFFRMLTFNAMRYSKKDIKILTEQGFFNAKILDGTYENFKLICVFCNFEFSSEKYPNRDLNVTSAQFHHNKVTPCCSRFERGLKFQKPLDLLGLTDVGMKYFVANKNQIRTLKPLFLDTMPRKAPSNENRLRCVVCYENMKNVLTSCNHIAMCSHCFTSDMNPNETRCVVCRRPFEFYCKVSLPEPTFGLTSNLNEIGR